MQYDRNDEITYDKEFQSASGREYCTGEEKEYNHTSNNTDDSSNKKVRTYPSVLIVQLIICIICAGFLYCAKNYFPDFYNIIADNISAMINDSLVVDGNNINDYFAVND